VTCGCSRGQVLPWLVGRNREGPGAHEMRPDPHRFNLHPPGTELGEFLSVVGGRLVQVNRVNLGWCREFVEQGSPLSFSNALSPALHRYLCPMSSCHISEHACSDSHLVGWWLPDWVLVVRIVGANRLRLRLSVSREVCLCSRVPQIFWALVTSLVRFFPLRSVREMVLYRPSVSLGKKSSERRGSGELKIMGRTMSG
jgi:hypothetical protein